MDIDPVIFEIGKQFHPEKPYEDPRIRIFVDDARAFFEKSRSKYDLIWFGFLDAHSLASSYNNIRLDHYVYTLESLEKARSLLNEQGVMVMLFAAQREWIAERLFGLFREVFKHEPLAFYHRRDDNYNGIVLIGSNADFTAKLASLDNDVRDFIEHNRVRYEPGIRLSTDDWPFLYLEGRQIPSLHLILSSILILCFLFFRRRILCANIIIEWHFFFLGAGFLLLEVQAITKGALLFGSTWIVNIIIISQVLVWILLSNYFSTKFPLKRIGSVMMFLFLDLAAFYFVPLKVFFLLNFGLRLILGSLFLTLPVFFGGILFISYFKDAKRKDHALGSNLIGALCGGLLESVAFLFGFKALLIPASLFYLAAYYARGIQKD